MSAARSRATRSCCCRWGWQICTRPFGRERNVRERELALRHAEVAEIPHDVLGIEHAEDHLSPNATEIVETRSSTSRCLRAVLMRPTLRAS